jgi:hypothetical protein
MSNISSFPTAIPDGDDLILGSQIDVAGIPSTKNFTVQQGVYRITSTGTPFTVNKTVVFINTGSTNNGVFEPRWSRISDTVVEIVSSSDYLCTNGSFEIKIYN